MELKISPVCLLGLIAFVAPSAAQPSAFEAKSTAPMLIVANKSEDSVSLVNLKTLRVVDKVATGRGPHEVAVSPDGKWASAANYEGPGDSISIIDLKAGQERGRIRLDPYRRPHGLAISKDGTRLYTTCEANQSVLEIEIATGKISRAFPTDQRITHMLTLAPDGRRLYAANIGSGSVTVLDLRDGRVVAQIATGAGCEGIDVAPDGKEVWATNREAGTVSIIETGANRVEDNLACPGFPIRLKFTPDGKRALVTCYEENSVAVFDVASRREIRRIRPSGSFRFRNPIGLVIDPEGQRAFFSDTRGDRVLVIDLATLTLVDGIPVGKEPDGLAYVPAR
jgi:YVTN family beta-propeller protein